MYLLEDIKVIGKEEGGAEGEGGGGGGGGRRGDG